jgi:putative transport protein
MLASLAAALNGLPPVAQVMLVLSLVGALGLLLGEMKFKGVGIGIGGVLFAGIAAGHVAKSAGIHLESAMLEFVREFGLMLFVYSIGIQVGPGFFASLKRNGLRLNFVAASVVVTGAVIAALFHLVLDVPLPAALGIMSGAVTNTPSLGAAQQILKDVGTSPELLAMPSLGYAVAYPFGIVGILLTMLLARRIFRLDSEEAAKAFEAERAAKALKLDTLDVVIRNEQIEGLRLDAVPGLAEAGVKASRMERDGALCVPHDHTVVRTGDVLHLVGPPAKLEGLRRALGAVHERKLTTQGTDLKWERLVVTEHRALGHSIGDLQLEEAYDVRVSRVTRAGVELVPSSTLPLQFGDILNVIGRPENLRKVAAVIGNKQQRLQQVEYVPVFVGLALGLILGSLPLAFPGMPAPLKLGLAGGPLVAAIVLSRIGHAAGLVWFMPPVANLALRELGIVLFLAVVGFRSGDRFVETLLGGQGLWWIAYGAVITLLPLLVAAAVGQLFLRLNYLTLCGLLAGSMTDPPALAFANAMSPSQAPALAYATVYPLVMCLRILAPQVLLLLLL